MFLWRLRLLIDKNSDVPGNCKKLISLKRETGLCAHSFIGTVHLLNDIGVERHVTTLVTYVPANLRTEEIGTQNMINFLNL